MLWNHGNHYSHAGCASHILFEGQNLCVRCVPCGQAPCRSADSPTALQHKFVLLLDCMGPVWVPELHASQGRDKAWTQAKRNQRRKGAHLRNWRQTPPNACRRVSEVLTTHTYDATEGHCLLHCSCEAWCPLLLSLQVVTSAWNLKFLFSCQGCNPCPTKSRACHECKEYSYPGTRQEI